jgi:hypothetical protein
MSGWLQARVRKASAHPRKLPNGVLTIVGPKVARCASLKECAGIAPAATAHLARPAAHAVMGQSRIGLVLAADRRAASPRAVNPDMVASCA